MPTSSRRVVTTFVLLFVLYQSAEGVGNLWLHSFAVQAALMAACVLAAWPLSHWLGFRGYRAYALQARPRWQAWLLGGLMLAAAGKMAAVLAGLHLGVYAAAPSGRAVVGTALLAAVPMLLVSTFVPSLAEDILTRGFWYRAAGIAWRRGAMFAGFSALLYVLNHAYRLQRGPVEWLMLFCFGIAYATALWRSGTLWAAVGVHWGWNLANGALALMLPVQSTDSRITSLLSAAAHLCMALVLLAVPATAGCARRRL